jgi:hypothetical protein
LCYSGGKEARFSTQSYLFDEIIKTIKILKHTNTKKDINCRISAYQSNARRNGIGI